MRGDRRRRTALFVMAVLFAVSIATVVWIAEHHHDTLIRTPPVVVSASPVPQRAPRIVVRPTVISQPGPGLTVTVTASPSARRTPRSSPTPSRSPRPTPRPSSSVCPYDHICITPPPRAVPSARTWTRRWT